MSSTGVRYVSSNAFMVRFAMTPAFARPCAVSCAIARAWLSYCLAIGYLRIFRVL